MWLLLPLILVNAFADNKTFILEYRLDLGVPINILDGLLALGVLVSIFPLRRSEPALDRPHPVILWAIPLLLTAAGVGVVGALINDVPSRWSITYARNMVTLPLAIFIGYRLIRSRRTARHFVNVQFWASLASALFALLFVSGTARDIQRGAAFDELRTTSFGGDAGLVALSLILFCAASGIRLVPRWVQLPALGLSIISILCLPHRSLWVLVALVLVYAVFVLPKGRVAPKITRGILYTVGLSVLLVAGVAVISQTTGRDYGSYVEKRLVSLLPGDDAMVRPEAKAWDTRLPSAGRELELWLSSPLFGRGFGIGDLDNFSTQYWGYHHNVWTSTLSETGVIGLAGFVITIFGTIVSGWRLVRDDLDRDSVLTGALGSICGFSALLIGSMSMSINMQRPALSLGLVCGATLACRVMELAAMRHGGMPEVAAPPAGGVPSYGEGNFVHAYE